MTLFRDFLIEEVLALLQGLEFSVQQYANIHITAVIAMHFCATLIRVSLLEIYRVHQKLRDVATSFSQVRTKN